jgi:hypothetical protein
MRLTLQLIRRATTIAAALGLAACGGPTERLPSQDVTATVRYFTIEGGFFALRGDDGVTYDPRQLDPAFAQDGLRVRARLVVRDDLIGIHMVGPLVDISSITKL